MVGKTFTYLIGSDAAAAFFNSRNEDLNAEEVYSRLTTPVFGKGVAYDVPNHVSKLIVFGNYVVLHWVVLNRLMRKIHQQSEKH